MGKKGESSCFGCLPWGRQRPQSSHGKRPTSAARTTKRPVSALVVKAGSNKSLTPLRGVLKNAPQPAPLQWRSQVGASDNSSTSSAAEDSETGMKPLAPLAASAFPTDEEPAMPTSRFNPALAPNAVNPPRHLTALPPRQSGNDGGAGAGGDYISGDRPSSRPTGASRPTAAFGEPDLVVPLSPGIPDGGSLAPLDKPAAAARLAELQQRFQAKSAARTRQSTPGKAGFTGASVSPEPPSLSATIAAGRPDDRFRGSQSHIGDGLSDTTPGAHGGGALSYGQGHDHGHSAPLPPLLAGAGGSGSYGPATGQQPRRADHRVVSPSSPGAGVRRPLPFMDMPGLSGSMQPRTDSLTVGIPGSLPSLTQPALGPGGLRHIAQAAPSASAGAGLNGFPGSSYSSTYSGAAVTAGSGAVTQQAVSAAGSPVPASGLYGGDGDDGFSFAPPAWKSGRKPGAGAGGASPLGPHHSTHGPAGFRSGQATMGQTHGSHYPGNPAPQKAAFGMESEQSCGRGHSADGASGGGSGAAGFAHGRHAGHPMGQRGLGGITSPRDSIDSSAGGGGYGAARGSVPASVPQLASREYHSGGSASPNDSTEPRQPVNAHQHHHQHQHQHQHQQQQQQQQQQQLQRLQQQPWQLGLLTESEQEAQESYSAPQQPSMLEDVPAAGQRGPTGARSASGGARSAAVEAATLPPAPWPAPDARPVTPAQQRIQAAQQNEAILASLLAGPGAFAGGAAKAPGGGGGTADELERFARVADAMSRLDDILAMPKTSSGRSLNTRSGATENAVTDFSGSSPAHAHPAIAVKPW